MLDQVANVIHVYVYAVVQLFRWEVLLFTCMWSQLSKQGVKHYTSFTFKEEDDHAYADSTGQLQADVVTNWAAPSWSNPHAAYNLMLHHLILG